jgi:protease IV
MVLPAQWPRPERRSRRAVPQASGGFGRFILMLLLFGSLGLNFLLCLGLAFFSRPGLGISDDGLVINEKHWSGSLTARDKVAVIHIEGILLDQAMGYTEKQIEKAAKDPDVKAVVVRINSPGGTITASDDIYKRLTGLRDGKSAQFDSPPKPLVASMGPMAASGGYYIAMPAKPIFAERTTVTGSIGVYASFINVHELAEKNGVHMELVKAGDVKGAGSMFKELKPEERQMWQDMVDNAYSQFISVVEIGRPHLKGQLTKDLERVGPQGEKLRDEILPRDKDGNIIKDAKPIPYKRKLADGGIFTVQEAQHYKLIDEIGFLEDATKKAAALANLSDYQVITYERPVTLLSLFGGGMTQRRPDFAKFAAASGPRIWYLGPNSEFAGMLAIMGNE